MNIKATALKLATLGTLAAAFVVASPARADAQVSFGVRVGPPVVYGYGHVRPYAPREYGYPGYYGHPYYGPTGMSTSMDAGITARTTCG